MTRTRAAEGRAPSHLMREYYRQRASAGLIVTECTAVRADSAGITNSPGIYTSEQLDGWREVVQAVHAGGGRLNLQVWHCGRISHPSLQPDGQVPIAPSAIAAKGQLYTPEGRAAYPTPRALELGEIAPIIKAFGDSAARARDAGFDGVELHAAFGYLPEQFLKDGTNTRTDMYGGSPANRIRFTLEVVEEMISAWGADYVGIKLSPSSTYYGQSESDAAVTYSLLCGELEKLKIGYIHVMEPNAEDLERHGLAKPTEVLRSAFNGTIISNGGYQRKTAEDAIESGFADLISFGTQFLANPDLPRRFSEASELNVPDPSTFYGRGSHGYTDYPFLLNSAAV